jgi:hypothetical protein
MTDEHKFDADGNLIYPNPEPEKYVKKLLKLGYKIKTNEYIDWEVRKRNYDNFNSVPKEKRKEILKAWNGTGKTIGQVAEEFKVKSEVVGDIIFFNIRHISGLNEESL